MKVVSVIKRMFLNTLKREKINIWNQANSKAGNVHLSLKEAACKKIPYSDTQVWLRPTNSDVARVNEYTSNIYFKNSYLHKRLLDECPTILIDIGANIGLSSLSLVEEFRSIRKVIAIEAEVNNFGLLEKNFKLWEKKFKYIQWVALNSVASHNDEEKLVRTKSLNELTGNNSASGTFRYSIDKNLQKDSDSYEQVVSIQKLIENLPESEKIIVKIDIEGGEEHLFKSNIEWLKRCLFLTCEIHDKFHPVMLNSSTNMIKALVESNFAFVASTDVLHCYNRDLLFSDDLT